MTKSNKTFYDTMRSLPITAWVIIYKYTFDFRTFVNLSLVERSSKRVSEENLEIKNRLLRYKFLWIAISSNGHALKYVPINEQFEELYLKAVKQNGLTLQYVPEENMTIEICLEAVKQSGESLQYVPEEKKIFRDMFSCGSAKRMYIRICS